MSTGSEIRAKINTEALSLRDSNQEPLLTLRPDGTVIARDDVAAQEAAQVFLRECSDIVAERDRLRATLNAIVGLARGGQANLPEREQVLVIKRPHVSYGPRGVLANQADANYLRSAIVNIQHSRCLGSNLTATVTALLEDVATQIEKGSSDDQSQV